MMEKSKIFTALILFMLSSTATSDFDLAQSIYNFAIETFQLVDKNNANFIMSPLSAQMILALTYDGASGPTAQAMNQALYLSGQTQDQATNDFNALISSLMNLEGNTTLNIANRVYLNDTFQVSPVFQADAAKFQSSVETINFVDSTDAADSINAWAAQETNGNIQEVVQASQFDDDTVMVLINAIYFQGRWMNQFAPADTAPNVFYTSPTTSQQILMMNTEDYFNYGFIPQLNGTALQMKYTDPSVSMILLLPTTRDGLPNLVFNCLQVNIPSIVAQMKLSKVQVRIPKYTINVNIDLKSVLREIGMDIIFHGDADFNNMVTAVPPGEHLSVSSVIQKAFIEVDEVGSTAAAVTVVEVAESSSASTSSENKQVDTFIADHPFLMIITKNTDVLFIGCFVEGKPVSNAGLSTPSSPSDES